MRRREFITAVGATIASPLAAGGQSNTGSSSQPLPCKPKRVGTMNCVATASY